MKMYACAHIHAYKSFPMPTYTLSVFVYTNVGTCVCLAHSVETKSSFKLNTLRTGDAGLRFYITTVQDG